MLNVIENVKNVKAQMRINALVKSYDEKIKKAESDLAILGELFMSTDNEQIAFGYNDLIIKISKQLEDLKQGREYYEKYGKVCELVASF